MSSLPTGSVRSSLLPTSSSQTSVSRSPSPGTGLSENNESRSSLRSPDCAPEALQISSAGLRKEVASRTAGKRRVSDLPSAIAPDELTSSGSESKKARLHSKSPPSEFARCDPQTFLDKLALDLIKTESESASTIEDSAIQSLQAQFEPETCGKELVLPGSGSTLESVEPATRTASVGLGGATVGLQLGTDSRLAKLSEDAWAIADPSRTEFVAGTGIGPLGILCEPAVITMEALESSLPKYFRRFLDVARSVGISCAEQLADCLALNSVAELENAISVAFPKATDSSASSTAFSMALERFSREKGLQSRYRDLDFDTAVVLSVNAKEAFPAPLAPPLIVQTLNAVGIVNYEQLLASVPASHLSAYLEFLAKRNPSCFSTLIAQLTIPRAFERAYRQSKPAVVDQRTSFQTSRTTADYLRSSGYDTLDDFLEEVPLDMLDVFVSKVKSLRITTGKKEMSATEEWALRYDIAANAVRDSA